MFVYVPRLRTCVVFVLLLLAGLSLMSGRASAAAPDPDPVPTSEAQLWAALGVVVGQAAPSGWVNGDGIGGPGPYFGDNPGRGSARTLADGSQLQVATGTGDAFSVFHAAAPNGGAGAVLSTASIDEEGVVRNIDLTGSGVVEREPNKPLLETDPVLWLAGVFGDGAVVVLGWATTDAANAATPDLSADWFGQAWARSYGLGAVVLIFLLAGKLGRGVKRGETGADWTADFGTAIAGFFVAAGLGPVVGQIAINGASGIAANAAGGIVGALQTISAAVKEATASTDDQALGASIVTLGVLLLCFIAAVVMLVVLLATFAVTYLSGALFLIAFAFIVARRFRAGAFRVLRVFAVAVATKPVLFIILSLAVSMIQAAVTAATGQTESIPPAGIVLISGSIIMLLAGAAPVLAWNYLGVSDSSHSAPGSGTNVLLLSRGARSMRGGK